VNVPVKVRGGRKPTTVNIGDVIVDEAAVRRAMSGVQGDRVVCCGQTLCASSLPHHLTSELHRKHRGRR
jgi:hypothetical protein